MMRFLRAAAALSTTWLACGATGLGQQPIGTVTTENASISGLVSVSNQKATITNQGSITAATNRIAQLDLTRGGMVRVCSTSTVHVSQSNTQATPPLLLALDRGALEANFPAGTTDTIMTPDLRFQLSGSGTLDLRLRVGTNGDTCVDNRAHPDAPTLHVTGQFGPEGYFIKPGQHLMFVHGDLLQVVDTETTNCGCPAPEPVKPPVAVASEDGKPLTPNQAAAEHPFPEAQSAGLAPMPETPQAPAGETHTQVSTAFTVNGAEPAPVPPAAVAAKPAPAPATGEPEKRQKKGGAFGAMGRFFKRLFGGK